MAVSKFPPAVPAYPLSSEYTVVAGYSSTGAYTINRTLPADTYYFYGSPEVTGNQVGLYFPASGKYVETNNAIAGIKATTSESSASISVVPPTTGTSWILGSIGSTAVLNDGTYNNGTYVLCGSGGQIYSTTDITNWTSRTSNVTGNLLKINYGNGYFLVAQGSGSSPINIYSTDGTSWTTANTTGIGQASSSQVIKYLNNVYIGATGTGYIYWKSNITTGNWSVTSAAIGGGSSGYCDFMYNPTSGVYVAVPDSSAGNIYTSTNLTSWTQRTSTTTNYGSYNSGFYLNGYFYVFDASGCNYSTDGTTWSRKSYPFTTSATRTKYINNMFHIVGQHNGNTINYWTTPDGLTYTRRTLNVNYATTTLSTLTVVGSQNGLALVSAYDTSATRLAIHPMKGATIGLYGANSSANLD